MPYFGKDASSPSVHPQGIAGRTDGVTPPAGSIGEEIRATSTVSVSQSNPTVGVYYDVTGVTITLGAGIWDVHFMNILGVSTNSAANLQAYVKSSLRTSANTIIAELPYAAVGGTSSSIGANLLLPMTFTKRVSLSSSTIYKMSAVWLSYIGSPTVTNLDSRGDLSPDGVYLLARRVA